MNVSCLLYFVIYALKGRSFDEDVTLGRFKNARKSKSPNGFGHLIIDCLVLENSDGACTCVAVATHW